MDIRARRGKAPYRAVAGNVEDGGAPEALEPIVRGEF